MFESHVETSVDSKSIRESLWHQITGPNTIRSLVPTPSVTVDQTFPPIRMGKAGSFIVWMKTQEKSAFLSEGSFTGDLFMGGQWLSSSWGLSQAAQVELHWCNWLFYWEINVHIDWIWLHKQGCTEISLKMCSTRSIVFQCFWFQLRLDYTMD